MMSAGLFLSMLRSSVNVKSDDHYSRMLSTTKRESRAVLWLLSIFSNECFEERRPAVL